MLVKREGGLNPSRGLSGRAAMCSSPQASSPQSSTFCSILFCAAGSKTSHAFVLQRLEMSKNSIFEFGLKPPCEKVIHCENRIPNFKWEKQTLMLIHNPLFQKFKCFFLCVHEDMEIVPFNLASHFQFPPAVESFHLVECTQVWSRPRSREGERNE